MSCIFLDNQRFPPYLTSRPLPCMACQCRLDAYVLSKCLPFTIPSLELHTRAIFLIQNFIPLSNRNNPQVVQILINPYPIHTTKIHMVHLQDFPPLEKEIVMRMLCDIRIYAALYKSTNHEPSSNEITNYCICYTQKSRAQCKTLTYQCWKFEMEFTTCKRTRTRQHYSVLIKNGQYILICLYIYI